YMADHNLVAMKQLWLKQAEEAKIKSEYEKDVATKAAFEATFKDVKVSPGVGVGESKQEGIVKDMGDGSYTVTYVVLKRGNYMHNYRRTYRFASTNELPAPMTPSAAAQAIVAALFNMYYFCCCLGQFLSKYQQYQHDINLWSDLGGGWFYALEYNNV
ncbi:hypothetical protein Tco_1572455, partial [Tanacetum coccineum]